jgi:hypothetical protein
MLVRLWIFSSPVTQECTQTTEQFVRGNVTGYVHAGDHTYQQNTDDVKHEICPAIAQTEQNLLDEFL